jgi:branched-chain amino acid transport system ATP-binding protein
MAEQQAASQSLLGVDSLVSGYGAAVVIDGVSFELSAGRSLAVLGRNGVGKTTLLDSLVGVTSRHAGTIRLDGRDLTRLRPEQRAAAGIGWVPQERNIFKSLTVHENLTAIARAGAWTPDRTYALFPRLAERRSNLGNQLSGGEQQMLAIARALVLNPKVLLLDEPTEGLAPIIVEELLATLGRLVREERISTIIVEQHAQKILGLVDDAIVLDRGQIVWSGDSRVLATDADLLAAHLGIAAPRRTG